VGALIPLGTCPILRGVGRLRAVDAAAIGAHYGSRSAATFRAATHFLDRVNEPCESYASAFLAVMESPALVVGILLGKFAGCDAGAGRRQAADIEEYANIQVEVFLQPAAAEERLRRLERDFFPRQTGIAYESNVRVVRRTKC
jgi:hypothetical protein